MRSKGTVPRFTSMYLEFEIYYISTIFEAVLGVIEQGLKNLLAQQPEQVNFQFRQITLSITVCRCPSSWWFSSSTNLYWSVLIMLSVYTMYLVYLSGFIFSIYFMNSIPNFIKYCLHSFCQNHMELIFQSPLFTAIMIRLTIDTLKQT